MTDPRLRASDTDRERHAELLREHAAQGRLTVDELDERLDQVYAARTHGELAPTVADLPAPPRPRPARTPAWQRPEVAAFLAVNLVLIVIWAATGAGYFWPIWPLLGWGLGLIGPWGQCRAVTPRHRPRAR
jgi:hypothetical protein